MLVSEWQVPHPGGLFDTIEVEACHAAVARSAAVVLVTVVAPTANLELGRVSKIASSGSGQPCTYELVTHPLLDSQRRTSGRSGVDVGAEP